MQKHGSKYFAYRHIIDPGMGSKGQTISFSESTHVAYNRGENLRHKIDLVNT